MNEAKPEPTIEFFQLWPDAPIPKPADSTICGSLPLRAFQYCEPFTTASGFGWYLFSPIDFDVIWDGRTILWRRDVTSEWKRIRTVVIDEIASAITNYGEQTGKSVPGVFPFLSDAPESGIMQIWPGLVIRTSPGWAVLIRPLANYPHDCAYEVLEGIIETDWWIGPLIMPIRIVKSDLVIEFRKRRPYAQIQLVHNRAYSSDTLSAAKSSIGVQTLPTELWDGFVENLFDHSRSDRKPGSYKRTARARRQSPQ